jgi:hypothetical protein
VQLTLRFKVERESGTESRTPSLSNVRELGKVHISTNVSDPRSVGSSLLMESLQRSKGGDRLVAYHAEV